MSNKTYSADEVVKQVLKKYHSLAKGLFASNKAEMCSPEKSEDTKESVFREIKWALDDIKCLKELSWTVEQEAPTAKEMFDKEFESKKAKLATLIRRHKALKKGEDSEDEDFMGKVDEMWKAEKSENKELKKADDSKLKAFLENKKAKKTSKMEKMLGMNQSTTQASTGTEAPKPKINMPGDQK